uniref:Prion protein n=1 Tax=Plectus sambesii TaxID=2011161 RepID=A0A914UMJ1_9BILA
MERTAVTFAFLLIANIVRTAHFVQQPCPNCYQQPNYGYVTTTLRPNMPRVNDYIYQDRIRSQQQQQSLNNYYNSPNSNYNRQLQDSVVNQQFSTTRSPFTLSPSQGNQNQFVPGQNGNSNQYQVPNNQGGNQYQTNADQNGNQGSYQGQNQGSYQGQNQNQPYQEGQYPEMNNDGFNNQMQSSSDNFGYNNNQQQATPALLSNALPWHQPQAVPYPTNNNSQNPNQFQSGQTQNGNQGNLNSQNQFQSTQNFNQGQNQGYTQYPGQQMTQVINQGQGSPQNQGLNQNQGYTQYPGQTTTQRFNQGQVNSQSQGYTQYPGQPTTQGPNQNQGYTQNLNDATPLNNNEMNGGNGFDYSTVTTTQPNVAIAGAGPGNASSQLKGWALTIVTCIISVVLVKYS